MLHILIIAHSYIAGSHRHVLLLAHKRPLSLTATGEYGGHGQWNPRQLLVRSAQNWAFCSLFTSPLSLLTVVARFSAQAFTIAVTLWHFSSPCMWSYRWTSCFPEQRGKTHCLTVQFLIFFRGTHASAWECVCACIRLHVILWKMIKWQDELWSMSCWQNTSRRVERESLDRPGPLLATRAGALQYKVHSVSVSHPQRTAAWALLTSTTSGY